MAWTTSKNAGNEASRIDRPHAISLHRPFQRKTAACLDAAPRIPRFNDWLVCMVSSQLDQCDEEVDEIIHPEDGDFSSSGLKAPSVLRLSRLAVLDEKLMVGSMGSIGDERLRQIRRKLSAWIANTV